MTIKFCNSILLSNDQIALICHRRFGVGADGLILLELAEGYDFKMLYYNSDGAESSMCGNGGRCIVKFAQEVGVIKDTCKFLAIDGDHYATISEEIVSLQMSEVSIVKKVGEDYELNTGSPHYVRLDSEIDKIDILPISQKIRYSDQYPQGINVNFVEEISPSEFKIRTYERGVEDETYSCGTGVTAASIIYGLKSDESTFKVHTLGGILSVKYDQVDGVYTNIFLQGPAVKAFEGVFIF
jgi:diaminopimelate epimerase